MFEVGMTVSGVLGRRVITAIATSHQRPSAADLHRLGARYIAGAGARVLALEIGWSEGGLRTVLNRLGYRLPAGELARRRAKAMQGVGSSWQAARPGVQQDEIIEIMTRDAPAVSRAIAVLEAAGKRVVQTLEGWAIGRGEPMSDRDLIRASRQVGR